jgi:hypothetical protein
VVDDEGTFYRVQCKTAWVTDRDTIRFNTHSQTTKNGQYHESSYDGDIDAFIVRNPADERLYWIGIEDANTTRLDLNYSAAIDHPSINWAPDLELDEEIPPSQG